MMQIEGRRQKNLEKHNKRGGSYWRTRWVVFSKGSMHTDKNI